MGMCNRRPVPVADLTDWLAGRWSVSRTVNGDQGQFTGIADFIPRGSRLVWHETGELRLDGHRGPARRTLTIGAAGDGWEVCFDDGRPFHPLRLADGPCEVVHLCGEDVYAGVYEVDADAAFTVRWHVVGPGRDDTIVSRYRRASSASPSAAIATPT